MSWFLIPDDVRYLPSRHRASLSFAAVPAVRAPVVAPGALGAAYAGRTWSWARPAAAAAAVPRSARQEGWARAADATGATVIRIPDDLLRSMADAARFTGRGEHEVWAEAARQWLSLRALDDDPQPPTPAAAAHPQPRRSWASIDALLADLRVIGHHPAAAERVGQSGPRRGSNGSSAA